MKAVKRKLLNVISLLSHFALKYKDMPALAYTHLQPAQLTTVGKTGHFMDQRTIDGSGRGRIPAGQFPFI